MVGKDVSQLFGLTGVSLQKSEIYVGNKKGVNCTNENRPNSWPLGRIALNSILNVTYVNYYIILHKLQIFKNYIKDDRI